MNHSNVFSNLKDQILDSASNQKVARQLSQDFLKAKRKGVNPVLRLNNGKNIVLKRISRIDSINIEKSRTTIS